MDAATASSPTKRNSVPPATSRVFEPVWAELERRHAWRILEDGVDNRKAAVAKLPYAWQDFDNRRAAAFRERHHLDALVAGAADDWEALQRLRNWAFTNIRNGSPSFDIADLSLTVDASQAGATWWCTFFAYAFVAAATAMGYTARHLGVDSDHAIDEPSTHHGVADVWVGSLRKWVMMDVNYDAHHELDGIPLSAEEIGKRWQSHRGAGVRAFIGPKRREVPRANGETKAGEPEACGFFWHYIDCDNDIFHARFHTNPVIFPVDEARRAAVWYQGPASSGKRHNRYADGTFLTTERIADAYPDIDCVELELQKPGKMPYYTPIRLWTSAAPNFSHHVIRLDGGAPMRFDGIEYPWRLEPGRRSIEVRVVNKAGHEGYAARIAVRIEEDLARPAQWPG
ncbi:MAG: hypothetical protein H0W83_06835 [Planctomycetes bacterium]|nr:hypothetical protein [Planctomycetota bacterium]